MRRVVHVAIAVAAGLFPVACGGDEEPESAEVSQAYFALENDMGVSEGTARSLVEDYCEARDDGQSESEALTPVIKDHLTGGGPLPQSISRDDLGGVLAVVTVIAEETCLA